MQRTTLAIAAVALLSATGIATEAEARKERSCVATLYVTYRLTFDRPAGGFQTIRSVQITDQQRYRGVGSAVRAKKAQGRACDAALDAALSSRTWEPRIRPQRARNLCNAELRQRRAKFAEVELLQLRAVADPGGADRFARLGQVTARCNAN
ncbi:MAG: hypothetical protein AAF909_13275 [Pseudomonadota bacterium]